MDVWITWVDKCMDSKKNVMYTNSQYVLSAIGPTNMILELVHCFVFLIITDLILKYIVMYE